MPLLPCRANTRLVRLVALYSALRLIVIASAAIGRRQSAPVRPAQLPPANSTATAPSTPAKGSPLARTLPFSDEAAAPATPVVDVSGDPQQIPVSPSKSRGDESSRGRRDSLANEVHQLQHDHDTAMQANQDLARANASQKVKIAKLRTELASTDTRLNEKIRHLEEELEKKQAHNEKLSQSVENLKYRCVKHEAADAARYLEASSRAATAEEQRDAARGLVLRFEEQLAALEREITILQAALRNQDDEVERLSSTNAGLQKLVANAESANIKLHHNHEDRCAAWAADREALEQQVKAAEITLHDSSNTISSYQSQLSALQEQCDQLHDKFRQQIHSSNRDTADAEAKYQQLYVQYNVTCDDLARVAGERDAAHQHLDELRAEAAELRELYSSASTGIADLAASANNFDTLGEYNELHHCIDEVVSV